MAIEFKATPDYDNKFAMKHIESGKFVGDIWHEDGIWFSTARSEQFIFTAQDHIAIADKLDQLNGAEE